jgi:hypothetical protein
LALLSAGSLLQGGSHEGFYVKNPIGTNVGYYMGADTPGWLLAIGNSIDIFSIWSLALAGIGLAIVAKIGRAWGLSAVFGWALVLLCAKVAVSGLHV